MPLFQNESKCETIQMKNEFDLHENEHASETNFHMNGFALRLVLKKRQNLIRKWPITTLACNVLLLKYFNTLINSRKHLQERENSD